MLVNNFDLSCLIRFAQYPQLFDDLEVTRVKNNTVGGAWRNRPEHDGGGICRYHDHH